MDPRLGVGIWTHPSWSRSSVVDPHAGLRPAPSYQGRAAATILEDVHICTPLPRATVRPGPFETSASASDKDSYDERMLHRTAGADFADGQQSVTAPVGRAQIGSRIARLGLKWMLSFGERCVVGPAADDVAARKRRTHR